MKRIDKIRKTLSEFTGYEKSEKLRKELKSIADKEYIQKYSDKEQIDFLGRHDVIIETVHPVLSSHPYYLSMFTILTQNIYADNLRQILDKGIDIERGLVNK